MRRREEQAKAQQERVQASSEEVHNQLQAEWAPFDASPAGAAAPPLQQPTVTQPSQTTHRRTQSAAVQSADPAGRLPQGASTYPQPTGQALQAGAYSTAGGAVQSLPKLALPTSSAPAAQTQGQNRHISTQATHQPRTVTARPSGTQHPPPSTRANRDRVSTKSESEKAPFIPSNQWRYRASSDQGRAAGQGTTAGSPMQTRLEPDVYCLGGKDSSITVDEIDHYDATQSTEVWMDGERGGPDVAALFPSNRCRGTTYEYERDEAKQGRNGSSYLHEDPARRVTIYQDSESGLDAVKEKHMRVLGAEYDEIEGLLREWTNLLDQPL